MMYQGLLGLFPFTVTELEVCTFRDLSRSREQAYAEHKIVSGLPRLQRLGSNLETLDMTILILPLSPLSTVGLRLLGLDALIEYGEELPLVLGLKYMGLFVPLARKIDHRIIHNGVTMSAQVSLSLKEYN
jgi:phage protein U